MKAERWCTAGIAAVLAFLISFGAVGCVVSGFHLAIADARAVTLAIILASVFCAAAFQAKWGGAAVLCALGLYGGYLWRQGDGLEQLLCLVQRLSHVYASAYGWPALRLVDVPWDAGIADIPMSVLGVLLSIVAARAVCRGKSAVLPVAAAVLALVPCLVVTDTVPGEEYLFPLLLGLVLLLLTARVRAHNPAQGNRLTAMAAIPTALALLGLFLAVPKEGYVNRSKATRDAILSRLQQVQTQAETAVQTQLNIAGEPESVNLAGLGRRIESPVVVMEVTAETGGVLYLRGQDYDRYDGTGWSGTEGRTEDFSLAGEDLGDVTVRTAGPSQTLYLPYYPARSMNLTGGKMENTWQYTQYVIPRAGLPEDWRSTAGAADAGVSSPDTVFLALPEATLAGARTILADILAGTDTVVEKAEKIGEFVKNSAEYSLNPPGMDTGAEDFALWFLESAESGYCVHFATAAAVLLRAAGIEARYVSGYLVKTNAGETAAVTGKNAHAWAEYYEPSLGAWLILEATPADMGAAREPQSAPESAPPTQAAPLPSQPPTEAAVPTAPTTQGEVPPETSPAVSPAPEKRRLPAVPIAAVLVILLVLVQRPVRIKLRKLRQQNAPSNARALALWQETELVSRLLKQPPPEELESLAQKAKFSRHTLTAEELSRFEAYLAVARGQLRREPWYRRLISRYVYTVI